MATKKLNINDLKVIVKKVLKESKLIKEGATLGIVGLFDDGKPDLTSTLDIAVAIQNVLYDKFPNKRISRDEFTIDGYENYNKPTGVLNFYLNNKFKESDRSTLNKIIETIKEFCNKHGLVLGKITAETSGPKTWSDDPENHEVIQYKKGEPLETIRVIRFPILENNSFIPDVPHEVGWSYSSIRRIFGDLLGFPIEKDQYGFSFNVNEILSKYKELIKKNQNHEIRITSDEWDRLHVIYDMAVWALDNGYRKIGGA